MQHCSMRRNTVRDGLKCSGGALIVSAASTAELVDTELSSNIAFGGRIGAFGGAVCVGDNSSLRLLRSTLARNVADGSNGTSSFAYGGAVFIGDESFGEASESEIVENVARAALSYPLGGAFYVENRARLVLTTCKVNRNVADGGSYSFNPGGGAINLDNVVGEIVDCELLENIARGGTYANGGNVPQTSEYVPSVYTPRTVCVGASIGSLACRCHVCFLFETKDERLVGQPKPSRGRR